MRPPEKVIKEEKVCASSRFARVLSATMVSSSAKVSISSFNIYVEVPMSTQFAPSYARMFPAVAPVKSSVVTRASNSAMVSMLVEEILLLKTFQSEAVMQPNVPLFAVAQVKTPDAFESPLPVRSVKYSLLMPKRGV